MAIASLVLGIVSIVFSLFFVAYWWVGALIGVVGIILGVMGKKDPEKKGIATAGMVCSIIGTALCVVFYLACVGTLAAITEAMN